MNYSELFKELLKNNYTKYGEDVDVCFKLKENKLFVFFQGSNSKIDWKNNFRFFAKMYKKQVSPMLVHKGFARAWKSCNDEIMEVIKLFKQDVGEELQTVFVGHSFGGAMALLAAEDYNFRFQGKPFVDEPTVITYGSPKVFATRKSVKYVRNCYKDIKQFAHKSDIVTYVPPFYKHVKKDKIGKFSFIDLFKPIIYHLIYGENIYDNENN